MLKTGGTLTAKLTEVTNQLNDKTQDSLAKVISGATAGNGVNLNFADAYKKFGDAVTASTDIIDEALKSNDLTELDTTNLKALRSYITETKSTFDTALKDSGLDATKQNADVTKEQLDKLQAGLKGTIELGENVSEKATATHKFSQNQPETVADMRAQLKTFAADPNRHQIDSYEFEVGYGEGTRPYY